jgi:multiple sugar transport system permease protein
MTRTTTTPRRAALTIASFAAVSFCVGPFAWQIMTSLRPEAEVSEPGLPRHLTLASHVEVLRGGGFARALWNSVVVASATTVVSLCIGSLAAFALAKLAFPGRKWLLAGALGVSMFPPIATVSPLYLGMRALGLLDRPLGLVIPSTTFALPLTLWVLTGFFREIPDELYRAARIDGCTPLQAFRKVMLPLALPGLATTAILVFVFAWNELLYALTFLSSPEHRTVPVAIALFAAEHKEPWAEIAAASVIATLPLLVATLIFQRRIVAGLTAGAVKG